MRLLNPKKQKAKRFLIITMMLVGWFIFVLYPNPFNLTASLYRLKNPPIMPLLVTELARELEYSSTLEIEQFAYTQLPYSYDWETYNMPWYFPTLDQALQSGSGDCKARYLLFASLLEELNVPYQKKMSLTHVWVDYEGKPQRAAENLDEAILNVNETGQLKYSIPRPGLTRASRNFYQGFWEVMPTGRKYLLLAGFPVILGLFYLPQAVLPAQRSILLRPGKWNKRR